MRMAHNLIIAYGLHKDLIMHSPGPATQSEITKFHSPDYIDFLKRVTPENLSSFKNNEDKIYYIGTECPPFKGLYEYTTYSAGGSIAAAKRLCDKSADIAIHWGGGMHHAKKGEASGFCYVNDIVLGILELLRVYKRVLYVDIDVHHGDGVEEAFYSTDRVMTCSFHKFGNYFPGTGDITDVGYGVGKNYAVNVPLKNGVDDKSYKSIFKPVIRSIFQYYQPEAVVLQCGADSLAGDRLGPFNLSSDGHGMAVEYIKSFNVPLMLVGGGGYTIENVARCWANETAIALGKDVPSNMPPNDYYNHYEPAYKTYVPSNRSMENENTSQYLSDLLMRIVENLRNIPSVPSVQMQEIPLNLDTAD